LPAPPAAPRPGPRPITGEVFVGQLSTDAIVSTIGPKSPPLGVFEQWLQARPQGFNEIHGEMGVLLAEWYQAFGDQLGQHSHERAAKVDITPELLRRWFGDAMLSQPVQIADLQRASVVDLLRLLDYPNDYVPVLTRHSPAAGDAPTLERVDVMYKAALNARLARSYLVELMDRARIA
jgi:hypothetical protein